MNVVDASGKTALVSASTLLPSVRTALSALVDYAGLFPPAKLEMRPALDEYTNARDGGYAWMLGRFIVPASRLKELHAGAGHGDIALSVIVDAHADPHTWFNSAHAVFTDVGARRSAGARIEALEVPLPRLSTKRETYDAAIGQCAMLAERSNLRSLPIYVEIPRDDRYAELLPGAFHALARYRLGAKIRCGGVVMEAFPSEEEVAAFLSAAASENVPFKATAGLHHPIRHRDNATGFLMHGFLNLLAASIFARSADEAVLREVLAEQTPSAFQFGDQGFAWRDRIANVAEIAAAREHAFVAYGSCSFSDPVDDLVALDILPK